MKRVSHLLVILLVVVLTGCGISSEGYRNVSLRGSKATHRQQGSSCARC
ncbi:lipoprotein [Neobacillus sp. CF12]|nr:lipoprotein [Neobacillus sp. CF12]